MNKILVVCTGNTCRSPMAEGIIRTIVERFAIQDVTVKSRGLSVFGEETVSENAVEALREIEIDISGHRADPVLSEDLLQADCIYVMTPQHKDVILDTLPDLADKIIVMEISDPYGQSLDRYRECRDEMLRYFEKELTGEAHDTTD